MMARSPPPASGRRAAGLPAAWRCGLSADHSWALIFDARLHNIAEVHRPVLPTGPDDVPPLPFEQAVLLMRFAPQLAGFVRDIAALPDGRPLALPCGRDVRHRARTLWQEIALDLQRVAGSASGQADSSAHAARTPP